MCNMLTTRIWKKDNIYDYTIKIKKLQTLLTLPEKTGILYIKEEYIFL